MKKVILTTICLMVLGITAQAQEKFYLVSAGVADYPGLKMDLRTCANDANTIRWVYQENKKAESVTLMNSKATIANILAALEQQFMKASSEDAIIFFFSGHVRLLRRTTGLFPHQENHGKEQGEVQDGLRRCLLLG